MQLTEGKKITKHILHQIWENQPFKKGFEEGKGKKKGWGRKEKGSGMEKEGTERKGKGKRKGTR